MSDETTQIRQHRPWLAPAIAAGLALIMLLVLLIPGVLRYRGGDDAASVAALREANQTLEEEIARLGAVDTAEICTYEGDLFPRSVEEGATPPAPDQRLDLLPPQPGNMTPDAGAVLEQTNFNGNIDELLRRSTVLVIAEQADGFANGTGFFIDARHIVTNAHVIEGSDEVIVTNDLIRAPLRARVVARTTGQGGPMPQQDFSLLQLPADVPTALPLTLGPARRTQTVYASGYPGFFLEGQILAYYQSIGQGQPAVPPEAVVTDGMVTTVQSVARPEGALGYIPHTARISPGNSGGPLVDACGRAVGINTFITQSADDNLMLHGDYALATDSLAAFLRQAGAQVQMTDQDCDPANAGNQG